jgi:hypothetical protein
VRREMNARLLDHKSRSRSSTRHAILVATLVAVSAVAFARLVFAQGTEDSALSPSPNEMGSGGATPPSFEEPWDDGTSSVAGPTLSPAPEEPAAASPGSTFEGFPSEPSAGAWLERPESQFAQPWVNPSISATNPMPELPSAGIGHGGIDGRIP